MARGRMINRRIATDQNFNKLTIEAQWFFMRMLPFMDDHGRLSGNLFRLKCEVIPSHPETDKKIRTLLEEIAGVGLIIWEEDLTVQFNGFYKNQKIGHKPAESEFFDLNCSANFEKAEKTVALKSPLKEGSGKASTQPSPKKDPEGFVEFWKSYPSKRRFNKAKCMVMYENALKAVEEPNVLMESLKNHIKIEWRDLEPKFIPHLTTWLNQNRWETEFKTEEDKKFTVCICTECGSSDTIVMTKNTEQCPQCHEYSFMSIMDARLIGGSNNEKRRV